jgi:hypothetical protein
MVPIKRPLVEFRDNANNMVSSTAKIAKSFVDDSRRAGTVKFDSVRGLLGGPDQFGITEGLPKTFDFKAVKNSRIANVENCMLCESKFKNKILKLNPIRHCKRCAKAICKGCSENKR